MSSTPMTETVPCFTDPHVSNGMKGAFHGAAFVLAAVMGCYNMAAWRAERKRPPDVRDAHRVRHLRVNTIVYVLAVWFEGYQISRHAGAPEAR